MTLYLRDDGPVCYEVPLWRTAVGPLPDAVQRLRSVPVSWWWLSEDHQFRRDLTPLDESSSSQLSVDLASGETEDVDRMIMLFGIDPTSPKIDAPEVFRHARLFDRGQQSLVRLIILDSGDEVEQFTFANASSPLDDLWRAFGRPPGEFKQRSYQGLHGIKLQNLLDQDSHSQ